MPSQDGVNPGTMTLMSTPSDLLSAATIAAELSVSDAKVKKAIAALGLAPTAKKGVCNLYARSAVAKIKKALG